MTTLTGQTVLITGANRGLGREFVEQFLTRGVAKVYAAARNPESITTDDPRVVPLQLDVTDPDSVARAAATAHDVSIVVNNAGVSTPTPGRGGRWGSRVGRIGRGGWSSGEKRVAGASAGSSRA